jgi:hypothetical protein
MERRRLALFKRRPIKWIRKSWPPILVGVCLVSALAAWAQTSDPFEAAPPIASKPALPPRPSHQIDPLPTAIPVPSPPALPVNPLQAERSSLLGVWRGSYACLQGETGVELAFTGIRDDGVVIGTFKFFNLPGHSNAANGEFTLAGRLNIGDHKLYFTPGNWISQPPGYVPFSFSISFPSMGERRIQGTITFPGCTQIYADKYN